MPVKVIFRGLILFRTEWVNKREVIVEALMPNTGRAPKGSSDATKHHDKKDARRHHPGILRVPGTKPIDITHALIDFSPESGGSHYVAASPVLNRLPRIDRPKGNVAAEPLIVDTDAHIGARIDMRFAVPPVLTCSDWENFSFGGLTPLPLELVATFDDEINVRVTTAASQPMRIHVEDGQSVYVYHSDYVDPDQEKLTKKLPIELQPGDEDTDFRWYYSLVEPRGDSFENWATGTLPTPVYTPPHAGPMTPSVSTCFPAWI